ncbi:hypothetical protein ABZY81_16180 [Streptomyces sp. NPDC006514]|uniref:ATP-grasp domain-containing protein n=1 Tax=Streptomyces sp. NPDC006514 TaxID=3154308 RepID=UPI0033B16A87
MRKNVKNVLIVNSRKPILPEVLHSDLFGRVTVITEPAFVDWYDERVEVRTVPSIDDLLAVKNAALDVLAAGPVDAVVSPAEHGIATAGFLRSYLGLPGLGYEAANSFANKLVMKQRLAAAGLPTAPFGPLYRLEDLPERAEELGWPVVLKAAFGTGCMSVFALGSPEEFELFAAGEEAERLREARCPLLVEKFVGMSGEYHCDGVVHDGEVRFVAASRYFMPLLGRFDEFTGSYFLPPDDPDRAVVEDLHRRVVEALGMRSGVTHLELFKTDEGFLVGEITCRPGGGGIVEAVRLGHGVDLWQAFLETALGQEPTLDPSPDERIVVNVDLPIRQGRIVEQTPAEVLEKLPDVLKVRMLHQAGDVVGYRLYSSAANGIVFLAVRSEDEVAQRVAGIAATYSAVVESVPAPGVV